jgi:hypothetical protein
MRQATTAETLVCRVSCLRHQILYVTSSNVSHYNKLF